VIKAIVGTKGKSGIPEFAGSTWVPLQYLLGLRKLGVESFWVDRLSPIDHLHHHHSLHYLIERFDHTARSFGLQDHYCIVYNDGERYFGMTEKQFMQVVAEAELLVSISGHLPPKSPLMRIPRRAYIDVDPGFVQIWAQQVDMALDRHNFFFTVGQNVGGPEFKIPTLGIYWHPIVPPVVLDLWPPHIDEQDQRFSTIADWRGSQEAVFEKEYYSGKREEFLRFLRLPLEAKQPIEPALCISHSEYEDLSLLHRRDWKIKDSYLYAGDPYSYREFIQFSRAEFSVAKNGYVKSNSGWISDRTACYLASGKPALVQSTGFEGYLPTGKGLLTFRIIEDAVRGIEAINNDYLFHCRAARQIAEKYFNSDVVLGYILEQVGL
jgi:hypothetical protein